MKLHQFLLAILGLTLLQNAAFAQQTTVTPWKIHGPDDMITVNGLALNIPRKFKPVIDSIGRMSMGCTGTHIGSNVVVSAGHCFNAPETLTENVPCADTTIEFGLRGDRDASIVARCTRILAMQVNDQQGLDYVFFMVDRAPRTFVNLDFTRPRLAMPLTMFSHPFGLPLRWSPRCVLVNAHPPVASRLHMHHRCDTNPGSSGAAVLNSENLSIMAIHDGGNNTYNYGTYIWSTPIRQVLIKNRIRLPLQQR